MRTTLNLDDTALDEARRVAPEMTKTQLINEALRAFARRKRLRGLLRLEGKVRWEGDLAALRKRRVTR
jgi:hypothetical protein